MHTDFYWYRPNSQVIGAPACVAVEGLCSGSVLAVKKQNGRNETRLFFPPLLPCFYLQKIESLLQKATLFCVCAFPGKENNNNNNYL